MITSERFPGGPIGPRTSAAGATPTDTSGQEATPRPESVSRETFDGASPSVRASSQELWSEAAERAVLAAMLIDHDATPAVAPLLRATDFWRAAHRALYEALQELRAQDTPVDPVTLAERLVGRGTLKPGPARELLAGLYDEIPHGQHVTAHAAIVRDYAQRRGLLRLAQRLVLEAKDTGVRVEAIRDFASRSLLEASAAVGEAGFRPIKHGVRRVLQRLQDLEAGTATAGLLTGWPELDEKLDGGFSAGDLVIVVGVPGSGKTSLVINLLGRLAVEQGLPSGFVSAEMEEELVSRALLSAFSEVPQAHIKRGEFGPDEAHRVVAAAARLSDAPFAIDDEAMPTIEDVVARCSLLKAQQPGLAAVGVDFIQLLQRRDKDRGELHERTLAHIAYALKALAKRLGIVVFAIAQPNDKQIEERDDKRPQLRDIQGSGGIRQAADAILLLYRPGQYSASAGPALEINLGKFRTGANTTVQLEWEGRFMRVTSPRRRQEELERRRARTRPLQLEEADRP